MFPRTWQTVRLALDYNLMERRQQMESLQQAPSGTCERLRDDHPGSPLELIDLGCADPTD